MHTIYVAYHPRKVYGLIDGQEPGQVITVGFSQVLRAKDLNHMQNLYIAYRHVDSLIRTYVA